MKTALKILTLFSALPIVSASQVCDKLANGRYRVEYDAKSSKFSQQIISQSPKDIRDSVSVKFDSFEENQNYEFIVEDRKYVKYFKSGDSSKGNIEWQFPCYFSLHPISRAKQDTLCELDRYFQKSFGKTIIELKEIRNHPSNDTIYFRTTYSAELHLTLNTGKMIRLH